VHPANTKANNRAMILIRAIPFCQVSKQGRRREWNAIIGIGGWKYDPRETGKARDHALRVGVSGRGEVAQFAKENIKSPCSDDRLRLSQLPYIRQISAGGQEGQETGGHASSKPG
jgi:hypothetical protein